MRERTQIDRQLIRREEFAALVGELQTLVDGTAMAEHRHIRTFFELTTALSFLHFARHQVDIAVVEVGLGGRLVTTNVLTPEVAVLTPIGLEHTRLLGDTLAAIAGEKAGIVKPNSCVVSASQAPEVIEVFARRCQEQDATLLLAGRDFQWQVEMSTCQGNRMHFDAGGQHLTDLEVPLLGRHQAANAAVALAVVSQLQQQGWPIIEEHIRQGLAHVRWDGRMEILSRAPWVLLDGAHTVEAAVCLRQALTELFPGRRVHVVLGISTDKNIAGMIATLAPIAHQVTVTRYQNPRAYDPHVLAEAVQRHGVAVQIEPDPIVALAQARSKAQPTDVVCVTGSLLLLGEIKARLQGLTPEFA
jgi:dihydrofolate synthase/folylpolyglutamate synthase